MSSFNPLSFTLAYHTLHIYGLSLIVNIVLLLLAYHLEVCASIGPLVMRRTKWPTTYTRYFTLGTQLLPAPQSPFCFHLGCS